MVWIVVRQEKDNEFMVECTLDSQVDEVTKTLANIHNLRARMAKLCEELDRVPAPKNDNDGKMEINTEMENPAYTTLKKQISDTRSHLSSVIVNLF
jgi:hypothetical protein